MSVYKNIIFIIKDYKKEFLKVLIFHFMHSLLLSLPSAILVLVLFELFKENINESRVYTLISLMGVFLILQLLFSAKAYTKASLLTFKISSDLRMKLGNHLYNLNLGFLEKRSPAYFSSLLLDDVKTFENYFSHGVPNLISGFFSIMILFTFLLFLDSYLAFLLFMGIVCIFPFSFFASMIIEKMGKKHIEAKTKMSSVFLEFCEGMKYLKSYNHVDLKYENLKKTLKEFKKVSFELEMFPSPLILISFVFCEIAFLFMIYKALEYYSKQELLLPILISFLIIGYRVYEPIKLFLVDFLEMKYMNSGLIRIIEIFQLKSLNNKDSHIELNNYDIKFKNVSFSYDEKVVLDSINLEFKQNEFSALVSYSGEGKSTILSLIARFWDVLEGEITIGSVNIKDISLQKLYSLISQVFQEVYLFDDSIYNNIKIAKMDAREDEIIEACKKSNCMEFINKLEDKIHTKVGESGILLSGGEKQRISIARALLKDSPIILLDEYTSSLDSSNEYFIQKAINELIKNKTVIIIAHKLASIKNANNIYVLGNKKILQKNTHNNLLKEKGVYKELWDYQESNSGWQIK